MPPLLTVADLHISFAADAGTRRAAVRGIDFTLAAGEVLGLVGASGCGKSTTAMALIDLLPATGRIDAGRINFAGHDLRRVARRLRGHRIGCIFQDPMTALNPYLRIETQLVEHQRWHRGGSRAQARRRALDLLDQVGIPAPERRIRDYPHQFSGGQRQRIMIACALACEPELLIADEPTTALDVTIQAEILALIASLRQRLGLAMLLITHDLGVVAGQCDRVCVMAQGQLIEEQAVDALFAAPQHPETRRLLDAVPVIPEPSS